jgi:hypothetical protein
MKLAAATLASIAWATLTSAQLTSSNASAPRVFGPSNSSHASHLEYTRCAMPARSVPMWWYNGWSNGPYDMFGAPYENWAMLTAYRAGGTENVHWKYTDNVNDPDCLNWWDYYAEDGRTLIANIIGRTTRVGDSRRWCALPVYRSGGVHGKQWEFCTCWEEGQPVQK